ncbi:MULTISPECIES: D-TA family PLP-dependent enzyme [Olivibacter]|jgi:D-serine deaminase-like pyridoxal phosphate-dependent protein|uniref:D-TA family PLP-dependent enzyme n=2 Tax=Olivibacter TaxID=376469 RepID=A0ABV6HI79_9SPHI|nr:MULTISPECIES: D-TA family PLP-dependent enzyme [Olivibacter]MCL4638433.1 D-TA family PLP-dependent enzyme [Olivibacter sp. UJ_SKK_5.1]MDX3913579.1 D-TA family PLP-dependent enzyme [Pseudosphingobacterium sp.]QEL01462.1 D-TA family PLP-dependent enzyme [Olivibacter sp. LS-1]
METEIASTYRISNVEDISTPALVVFPELVKNNIQLLMSMVKSVDKLRPHIKTSKSADAIQLLQLAGINKFKCATIAEAELLGDCGVQDVLLAYQPVGPNINRFIALVKRFPNTSFACLVDQFDIASQLNQVAFAESFNLNIYFDINVGMNRTGIKTDKVSALAEQCSSLSNLILLGLHCYDGHIHEASLEARQNQCHRYFTEIEQLIVQLNALYQRRLIIVAGGTPTFPIHAASERDDVECSPGTFIFWDKGYQNLFTEQPFQIAALVLSRVISIIDDKRLCLDLGHKAIASENELGKRVFFINAPEARAISHSEEHLVIEVSDTGDYTVGDVLYGIPYHICPTVALYDTAFAVTDNQWNGEWQIIARKRKLTI